ncbi:hypothetical protein [Candidatus Poriferisodalis sp.]
MAAENPDDVGDRLASYLPRVVNAEIERLLRLVPTVVLEGPR